MPDSEPLAPEGPMPEGTDASGGAGEGSARRTGAAAGFIADVTGGGMSSSLGVMLFVFGAAAGFMVAFSGLGILNDLTGIILLAGLSALLFIGAFALLAFLFRKPLLRRLFGFAETQVNTFAGPLADIARSAVDRNPQRATDAARELVQLSLARYAWLSTRRWIIGSMTALIAAIAALAGTTLLYRQNQLLAVQSELLGEQNQRIGEQSVLLLQSVELAEAARNAALAVEITAIAGELGLAVDRALAARRDELAPLLTDKPTEIDAMDPQLVELALRIPELDPLRDLEQGLIMRIASTSRATKPYRFLDPGYRVENPDDRNRIAVLTRRADLPLAYERFATQRGWAEPAEGAVLIDRLASPERGQLLEALTRAGIVDFDALTFFGLDLSFAYAPGLQLRNGSLKLARLGFADLSFATLDRVEFAGATLDNVRLRNSFVRATRFSAPQAAALPGIFAAASNVSRSASMAGADFSHSALVETGFEGVTALAMNFDGAMLDRVDFANAEISGSTFRGALLVETGFASTSLASVDFDGAYVFGADFLEHLTATSLEASFQPDRFTLVPADFEELTLIPSVQLYGERQRLSALHQANGLFRISRVSDFD